MRCVAYAGRVEGSGSAVIELWCASCRQNDFAFAYGVSFLLISFALIVLGILIELISQKVVVHQLSTFDGLKKK